VRAELAALALAGCGTLTSYQTAEPVARGHVRVAAALTGGTFADTEQGTRTPSLQGEVEGRYGVAANVDVGLKLYTVGAELSGRWRIVDGAWAIALLGAVGGVRNTDRALVADGLLVHARIGAVATHRTSARWAFSFGPALTASRYAFDGGGAATGVLVGGIVNAECRLGRRWRLVPELGLHATVAGEVPVVGWIGELGVGAAIDF
jgi:hypothetical protein